MVERNKPNGPRFLTAVVPMTGVVVFFVGVLSGVGLWVSVPSRMPGMSAPARLGASLAYTSAPMSTTRKVEAPVETDPEPPAEAAPASAEPAANPTSAGLPTDSKADFIAHQVAHTRESLDMLEARWAFSQRLISTGELQGEAIAAFLSTPREDFVREQNLSRAYDDTWLPVGYGATITDPDVVAMMTTTLDVGPDDKVLEIGTGSGYQSAILSHLSSHIYTIEIIEPLYEETDLLYTALERDYPTYRHITRKLGDGFYGWEKYAPFDRIIVTCAIDHVPPPLVKQLAPDGIMVVPLGSPARQYIMEIRKSTDENGNVVLSRRDVYNGLSVRFIQFRSETGQSYSGGGTAPTSDEGRR